MYGASPAALIEGVHFYTAEGELREKYTIGIAVVGEAVDEDEGGFW
jgi:hypothetical protein